MKDVAINRIMTTNPKTVEPGDHLSIAKKIFEGGEIHHLPVVEDGRLAGIVSSSDLLKFYLLDDDPSVISAATVGQVMESDPVVLSTDASLRDAATALSIGGYHAVPVVDGNRELVGIVTTSDLVTHLLQQIPRDDGSLNETARTSSPGQVSDDQISRAVALAKQAEEQGSDSAGLSRVLLHYREQNRLLERVRKAAELYLRSGHGEHEHSVLTKTLSDIQRQ